MPKKPKKNLELSNEQVARILAALREVEGWLRSIPYQSTVKSRAHYANECRESLQGIRKELSGE